MNRRLIEEAIAFIDADRTQLIDSYATPPNDGEQPNIETIDERSVYDEITAMGAWLVRARAELENDLSLRQAGLDIVTMLERSRVDAIEASHFISRAMARNLELVEMLKRAEGWISTQPDHEKMTTAIREILK